MEGSQLTYVPKIAVGLPAPDFEADSWFNGFKKVKLSDYKGNPKA
jgi:hypothetical protein